MLHNLFQFVSDKVRTAINRRHQTCWIQTYTGRKYHFYDPTPEMVHIEDVAHALSLGCRFNGHTREFYSIAQHSVMVADIVESIDPSFTPEALMHDGPEAYVTDVPKPFKDSIIDAFGPVEQKAWDVMSMKWGLTPNLPDVVKFADFQALLLEKQQLLPEYVKWPNITQDMYDGLPDIEIIPLPPGKAKKLFMMRFEKLLGSQSGNARAA